MRWLHRPPHRIVRDDDSPCRSRRRLPRDGVDGLEGQDSGVRRQECNETHNRDSPYHIPQRRLSSSFHQMDGCEPRTVNL